MIHKPNHRISLRTLSFLPASGVKAFQVLFTIGMTIASFLVVAQPSNQVTNLIIKPVTGSSDIRIDWTNGNGTKRLVIVKDPTGVFTPVNGSTYAPNPDFSLGSNITTGGGIVKSVFDNTGTTVTVSNLTPGTTYRVEVYEYTAAGSLYQTNVAAGNPMWFRTFNTLGDNSWVVPTGINSTYVQTWGSGGGGGGGDPTGGAANGGSGGGGGAYAATNNVAVIPGATMHAFVATGGNGGAANGAGPVTAPGGGAFSWFGTTSLIGSALVKAEGGAAGTSNSTAAGGNGGAGSNSLGSVKNDGGQGGKGEAASGGGGGGSGAPNVTGNGQNGNNGGNGNSGTGGGGGAARVGGAAGGDGQDDGVNTTMAQADTPGGGGGGTQDSNTSVAGQGGNGLVLVSYTQPINQNLVFAASTTKVGGAAVTIVSSGPSSNAVWFAPAGTTTFAASGTMTTAAGNATTINAPANAGTYVLYVIDVAGNVSLPSTATLTVDNTPPTISATSPITNAFVANSNVSYTLSEAIVAAPGSKIRWARTSGNPDPSSPHDYLLTAGELTIGAHTNLTLAGVTLVNGTTYTVTFDAVDAAGNAATQVVATNVTMDTSPPAALTVGSVVTTGGNSVLNYWNTTNTGVDIQVPVDLANTDPSLTGGTIQLQARISSGSFANIGSPYTILNGDRGSNKTLSLTSGQIAAIASYADATTLQFTAIVKDQAGNSATVTQSATNLLVDITVPVISAVAPVASGFVKTSNVSYTLSEPISATSGSRIRWNRTSGSTDAGSPHDYFLTAGELTSGAHSNIALASVTLVDASVYSVIFDAQDVAGNPAVTVTSLNVTYDITPPTITATTPSANAAINVANVGYTFSEACQTATVDYNRTGGNADVNHTLNLTAGQLTTGAHAVSTGLPTLVDGAIYDIVFNATDLAGNTATTVTNSNVLYDVSQPAALTVGTVTTTGGNSVTNFWNTTNTGLDISVPVDLANTDPSITGGSIQLQARISSGSFANIGSPYAILGSDRGGSVTLSLTSGQITAIAGYANATTLQFTAVVKDRAGNSATVSQSPSNVLVDIVVPVISATSPASSSFVNTSNVSYTLSEPISATTGSRIRWNATGGTADGASPHDYFLSGAELTSGAHTNIALSSVTLVDGAIYSVIFDARDVAGNPASTVTKNLVEYDASVPNAFTVGGVVSTTGTVVAGYWNGTNTGVNVQVPVDIGTIDPTVVGGTIQVQARIASGTFANVGTPYTIVLGDRNTTKTMALSAGNITGIAGYAQTVSLEFRAVITDRAGNATTGTQSASTLTVDTVAPVISSTSPANSSSVNTSNVSYTLSETGSAVAASKITWTRTSGAPDGASPHVYLLTGAELSSGAHINIPLASVTLVDNTVYNVTFDLQDIAGNAATTVTKNSVTYDITAPVVNSIVIGATPLKGIGSTNGTTSTSLLYTVTFSEPVTGVDAADFSLTTGGSLIANVGTITGGPTAYSVTVNVVSGYGTSRLDFFANGTVKDLATNSAVTSFTSGGPGATYTYVLPEPATHVTGFTATPGPDNYSVTLTWSADSPTANGYVIRVKGQLDDDSNGVFIPVNDAAVPTSDFVFTDGNGLAFQGTGILSYTFSSLLSGKTYTFEIIPYAYNGFYSVDNIDYKVDGAQPSKTATVGTGSLSTITNLVAAPATISSLTTSYAGTFNLVFNLSDDGGTPGIDNSRTRFTDLVISAGGANTVTNWSDVIAEAQLTDFTENPASPVLTTTIGTNTITFSGLATGSNGVGALDDNEVKQYRLRVRLKNPLTGGANLTVDNQVFDFSVSTGSFTYNTALSQPSRFAPLQLATSGPGRNIVSVIASTVTFNPSFGGVQPPTTALALTNLSVTPIARAVDANGNTDLNFTSNMSVTTTGGLSVSPTPISISPSNGIYTFPAGFQYTDAGTGSANNGTLILSDGASVTGNSNGVTVSYSNTTTIVAGANPEAPTFNVINPTYNIPGSRVFDFDVVDDNGSGGDGVPTVLTQVILTQGTGNDIADWTQVITGAVLYDGVGGASPAVGHFIGGTVGPTSITFPGIPALLGTVNDNGSHNYQLYLTISSSLPAALKTSIDGLNLVFEVLKANVTTALNSSAIAAGENENSGSTNIAMDVLATKLSVINPIGNPTLVSKDISIQQAVPTVEAIDANGNRDLNYNSTGISLSDGNIPARTFINPPAANSMTAGFLSFPNNFQYTSVGGPAIATLSSSTLNAVGGSLAAASFGSFSVTSGIASTITNGVASSGTITSITNASPGTAVFNFVVNDDPSGTPALQDDGSATFVNFVRITQSASNTITDWTQAIAGAILSDGNPAHDITATSITGTDITFNGSGSGIFAASPLLSTVGDNTPKTFTLKIWLKTSLGGSLPSTIDGQSFGFELLSNPVNQNILATAAGTGMLNVPTQQINFGSANTVAVVATELRYFNPLFSSFPLSASLNSNFPGGASQLTWESTDANGNRDLGFNGASGQITAFTNASGLTTSPTSGSIVGTQFTNGVYALPNTFKYTSGSNGNDATISITATGGIVAPTFPNMIQILSSFESSLINDPTFSYPLTLDYVNHQDSVNIQNNSASMDIARMLLVDGSRSFALYGATTITTPFNDFGAFVNVDSGVSGDADGASTNLTSLTLRISRPSNIRRIALYSGGVEIPGTEIDVSAIGAITGATAFYDFVFNGAPLLVAADDSQIDLSVRVSFRNLPTFIKDQDPLNVAVIAATATGGSLFFADAIMPSPPPNTTLANYKAGVQGGVTTGGAQAGYRSPAGVNIIDVVATKLDFIAPLPATFAGINKPISILGTVKARDQKSNVDLNFNAPVSLSGISAIPTFTGSFVNGSVSLNGMRYISTGNGTLTVTAGGLNSNTNNVVGGWVNKSTPSPSPINVMHVTSTLTTGGVTTSSNLIGGTSGAVIFGATFTASGVAAGEPKLNGFNISFSNPYSGILNNPRVFESASSIYGPGATDVTTIGGTVSTPSSTTITVAFGTPRDLTAGSKSYFLIVDVDPNASGSTPPIQPSITDNGFGSPTDTNITTTQGTATSNGSVGQSYTFASIFPPTIVRSVPAKGQLNVAPNQGTLDIYFSVPVWSLDQKVLLYDQTANTGPYTLTATNGAYGVAPGNPLTLASPVSFTGMPTLIADHIYYVTIAAGNQALNTGVMDQNGNVFQGISYPGALYFKAASTVAPNMLGISSAQTPPKTVPQNPRVDPNSITTTSATINASFDAFGTAHYLILSTGSAAPTVAQVKGAAYSPAGSVFAQGSFPITQIFPSPQPQFGIVTPTTPFIVGNTYDVWMAADNDAPGVYKVTTSGTYGGLASNFAIGGVGPTMNFTVGPDPTVVTLNTPSIAVCTNSLQIMDAPIIISEGTSGDFQTSGQQSFNLVLPAGFQFDVTINSSTGAPNYGNLQLVGSDFSGAGALSFIGNSILTVTFANSGTTSLDKIIITGLRVISSTATSGQFLRLGGQAIPALADQTSFATITSYDAAVIGFTNSYSTTLLPAPTSIVTSIPDNANPSLITLSPTTATGGPLTGTGTLNDYGPSTFSGQGVSINQLSLAGVTLDAPFNISVTHTDNNGCISTNAIQYTVYDHNTALNITTNLLTSGGTTIVVAPPAPLNSFCASNANFKVNQVNPPPYNAAGHVRYLDYKGLAPYYQMSVSADIPTGVPAQFITGPAWKNLIQNSLLTKITPGHTIGPDIFFDYKFDDAVISDAATVSGGALPDPYTYFRSTVVSQATGATLTFYAGGSLGFVDITGFFQSRTNSAVKTQRAQRVQFFLPAVPIVDGSLPSFIDVTDPLNPPNAVVQNPGTLVYCEAGGVINISARPTPVPGRSTGTFTLVDMSNNPIATAGFTDNTNGTAKIDPTILKNGYANIRVIYTYQDASPCGASASQIIRITPNPVANFTTAAVVGPNVGSSTSFCVDNQINFDAATSSISAAPGGTPGNFIAKYKWDFDDLVSANNSSTIVNPNHTFTRAQPFQVGLDLESNWKCPSVPVTTPTVVGTFRNTLNVGGIPVVKTRFDGVSTQDSFNFFDNGSTVANSTIANRDWDYNYPSGSTFNVDASGATVSTNFSTPGKVMYDMRVTSSLGCINSVYLTNKALGFSDADNDKLRTLVVLPRAVAASGTVGYAENFESSSGNWQVWYASNANFPLTFQTPSTASGVVITPDPSWKWGAPDGPATAGAVGIVNDVSITGTKYWKTYDATTKRYRGNERSALYSPSMDLTALSTPMISFNSWTQLEPSDGVILEYSQDGLNVADPSKVWIVLGKIGEGVGWFTDKGVAAKPGAQIGNDLGWSNTGNNTGWIDSKHTLDEIASTGSGSLANRLGRVVFRFSLASAKQDNGLTVDGFGIDNVRIGERTRTILLESFANTSNTAPPPQYSEKTIADSLSYFPAKYAGAPTIGTQVIKVNYHLNFPANDPFNQQNPADPSSRALFYNIVSTPKSILDGHKDDLDRPFTVWSRQSYGTRSLQLAQATLTTAVSTSSPGVVNINVKVDAVFDLPANTVLHVAVLETGVPLGSLTTAQKAQVLTGETQFYYLLKAMLPSASGTPFGTVLKTGSSRSFNNIQWTPDPAKLYAPSNDLAVVVFLQNESTKEVYQVSYTTGLTDPGVVTGIEPVLAEDVQVYPVPANREMHVVMPGVLLNPASVQLIDQTGRAAIETTIQGGQTSKTLNVGELAQGVYILQINVGNGNFTRKKVMVIHD